MNRRRLSNRLTRVLGGDEFQVQGLGLVVEVFDAPGLSFISAALVEPDIRSSSGSTASPGPRISARGLRGGFQEWARLRSPF